MEDSLTRDEMRERALTGWSTVADEYVHELFDELDRKPYDRALLDSFASIASGSVLDIGCGPGHVSKYLAARGLRMHGIDLSPDMIARARDLVPEATFEVGDMLALDLPPGRHGGAVLMYSLINLVREDVPSVLASVARGLAPGAPILVAVHRGKGLVHAGEVLGKRVTMSATLFEPEEIARYATETNLDALRCETRPPYEGEYASERIYLVARRK